MAAIRRDRIAAERALYDFLSSRGPVYRRRPEEPPIWLLFVHLDTLFVSGEYSDARFQVRIRYGGGGVYQEKYSQKVHTSSLGMGQSVIQQGSVVEIHGLVGSAELNGSVGVCERWDAERGRWAVRLSSGEAKAVQLANIRSLGAGSAEFGSMLVFRWDPKLPATVTFEVLKLGFFDNVVSRRSLSIPFREGVPGAAEQELLFVKRKKGISCANPFSKKPPEPPDPPGIVGHLGVTVELRRFTMQELEDGVNGMSELISMLDMFISSQMGAAAAHHAAQQMYGQPAMAGGPPGGPRSYSRGSCVTGTQTGGLGGGGTPVVIGRPIPGSMGWTWNGSPVRPQ